jgi:hypothetical protein
VLTSERVRTIISASGKASGGFRRWHGREVTTAPRPRTVPTADVTAVRVGDTVTVNLAVHDPSLIAVSIEYKEKEGIDAGDTLDGAWNTWTGGTGTPGADEDLARTHNLTVQGGLGGEFLWRVGYRSPGGVTKYISDSFTPQNLEEEEKVVAVDFLVMIHTKGSGAIAYSTAGNYAYPTEIDEGGVEWRGTVQPIPVGSEITALRARMASLADDAAPVSNAFISLVVVDAGDLQSVIAGALTWDTEGASWKEDATVGHVVAEEEAFHLLVNFQHQETLEDERFYRAEITYSTPAYRFNL